MIEENTVETQKKIEASNTQPKIVMIPIEKIRPCRWSTGIRDPEVFERLKENIKAHGLNSPPRVRPIGDGFYEAHIGDHRVLACKELGYKEIPCIVDDIDEDKALEMCISDNICRADLSCTELETKITELWNSQRYQAKEMLGRAIGLTGQRVGQLIGAKVIRDKAKIPFDASISTQCINDTYPLSDINDKLALLELVRTRKIKPSDVKDYAKTLAKTSGETRKKVLYDGHPLSSIGNEKMNLPKKAISSKSQLLNPNLLQEIYQLLNTVQDHVALIEDVSKKKEAINYVKFYSGLFLKILYVEGVIQKDFFESVVRHELDIDEEQLHHFDGLRTKGVSYWLSSDHNDDAEEVTP